MAVANENTSTLLPLDGRVALVTGGSRGIGREVSSHLAALGALVVVNYASNSARADELVAELASCGHQAVAVRADVSDPDAVRALFDRAEEAFGSAPHIVVACAGVLSDKYPALADTSVEDFDAMFAVNVRGTFLVCREAAKRVPANSGGRIVTFSSSIVGTLLPGYAAYTATNAAVEAMTKILAKEVAAKGVTANVVAPGPVSTELFLAGKDEAFLRRVGGAVHGAHRRDYGRGAGGGVPCQRRRVLGERPGHQGERRFRLTARSFGLFPADSANQPTSQQCFSHRKNQPTVLSANQPAYFQPNEQAVI